MMKKFKVHVCTISDQATPNYVPILDLAIRPEIVILLVSERMQPKAVAFQAVLKHYCNEVAVEVIKIEDELELTALKDRLFDKIAALDIPSEQVAFNITGGTKLMAIEAYMLAKDLECEPFYFVPESNEILFLNSRDSQKSVPKNVTVEDYLQLHGYKIKNNPTKRNAQKCQDTHALLVALMALSPMQRKSLTQFYGIISSNNPQQMKFNLDKTSVHASLENIIYLFHDAGFLKYEEDTITFLDESDKKFVHGGWFEEYVFNVVRSLEGIQDCLMNIEIISDDQKDQRKTRNEVDVAYMKDNALHVIECKSKNYDSKNNRSNNDIVGNGDLFKLETLQKLGGLYTKKIFISYLDVPKFMKDRADFSRIKLIELNHQANLKTSLEK